MMDYVINFVNHFNPNGQNLTRWPKYTPSSPTLLTILDGSEPLVLTNDTFREKAMEYVLELAHQYPL